MKKIVVVLSFLLISSVGFCQHGSSKDGIKFVEGKSWEKILKMAGKKEKLIFLDCYTSWCGPCKALAKDIFTQKKVGDFFNASFINTHYDMEKGEGKMLYKRYKKYIIGFPTLLLIDNTGKVLHQMAGFQKADVLIKGMKDGLEGKSLFAMKEKYEAGEKDMVFLKQYITALNGAFLKDDISKVIKEYINSIPMERLKEKEVWDFVKNEIKDPYSKEYKFVVGNLDYYRRKLKEDRYELEWKLGWQLSKAVKDIVLVKGKELKSCPEKQEQLISLLKSSNFKKAEENIAMLAIHKYKIANNVPKVFELFCNSIEFGMFENHSSFYIETIKFLVKNTNDRNVVDACHKWIYDIQMSAKNSKYGVNYYNILASIYEKQGDDVKAKDARGKYEKIEEAKRKKFENYLKKK